MYCQKMEKDGVTQKESSDEDEIITARYVAIATGHHASPVVPMFRGEDTFTGTQDLHLATNHLIK